MNVYIGKPVIVSDMQGPCPDGFHVPTVVDWTNIKNAMDGLSQSTAYVEKLHIPLAGYRTYDTSAITSNGTEARFWSSTRYDNGNAREADISISGYAAQNRGTGFAYTIRPFKNTAVTPTSSWTTIYQGSGSAGIFWNQTDGLISISSDGSTWYTIADKNLGATTVWNSGDTLSESNCGYYYQRGNNYAFPGIGSSTTWVNSYSQVDASNYGPGNYYNDKYFRRLGDWESSLNKNLRGGISQGSGTKSVEVKNIYIGEYKNPERIEYKMNADSSGILYVPVGGYGTSGGAGESYNRKISVDGGAETTYSGTGSSGGSITLSGYTAGSSHTIKIVPTTEAYLRARAYGWFNTSGAPHLTEIIYDSSYMGYAVSATDTGAYFRCRNYYGCTNLTKPAEEYLPDTVTTIGDQFMRNSYYGCTSLTYASEESLPSSVTSIGTYFRGYQYQGCTALTEVKGWKDLSIGNGTRYRQQQFYDCTSNKTVKVIGDVGYSSYAQNALPDNYVTSVSVPSAYLTNFKNASNYPWVGITDSKFIGY